MKEKIRNFAHAFGITEFGICKADDKYALVFLFPYYNKTMCGNISKYAISVDYHKIVIKYLNEIIAYIKTLLPVFDGTAYCDISPFNEKKLAASAGLGFYGKNSLLINPFLGSYFFIGIIITDYEFECDTPLNIECKGCLKCIESCPGNALANGFNKASCASHISQKKGELTKTEQEILLKSGKIWGCDICQDVCPHNKNISQSLIPEFAQDLILNLHFNDISTLSERSFKKKYVKRAFSWKGKAPLIRNIILFDKKERKNGC